MKKVFLICLLFIFTGCGSRPTPDKLPASVKSVFHLLVEKPQFVMYFNFGNMRNSEFWKKNVLDSVLTAENTLGSILNTFKKATGVSISQGLDEMFFANSWFGDNSIVLKGVFDRSKLDSYISSDSNFTKKEYPGNITLYIQKETNLQFFFKDNITLCASNYTRQIENMMNASDTSKTGLAANEELISAIGKINYKNNLWLVTAEKTFIRGIFQNFINSKNPVSDTARTLRIDSLENEAAGNSDSLSKTDKVIVDELYKQINSVSLSAKMDDELDVNIQFECFDDFSAEFIKKLITGMITLSKIGTTPSKDRPPSASEKILESLEVNNYESSVILQILITKDNIEDFRKNTLLKKPNE